MDRKIIYNQIADILFYVTNTNDFDTLKKYQDILETIIQDIKENEWF